jgi:glycosyltransferase involved in cell wall biosynthesis
MPQITVDVPSLSLIFLMYNERENIGPVLQEALDFAAADLGEWEIIVVDDGSTDGSHEVVEAFVAREPRIRLIRHPQNRGMGGGMRTGLDAATCDYFVYFPADGQLSPFELRRMLPLLGGGDIILSVYPHRHSSFQRAIVSRFFRDYMLLVAKVRFQLEGLYLYPTEVGRRVMPSVRGTSFFFSFDLIQRGIEAGLSTVLTTIDCRPRATGSSKVTGWRTIRRVIKEVAEYRLRREWEERIRS